MTVNRLRDVPTERQMEVLHLIAQGFTDREIGMYLGLSQNTVRTMSAHLLTRLHAKTRSHAVAIGFQRGWLT